MGRELRFREWTPETNEMFYKSCKNLKYSNEDYLMQYIGLTDRNGKSIYEGDILETPQKDAKVIIEFVAGQYIGKNTDKDHPIQETQNRNWLQWEVTGNIYQNQ